MPSSAVGDGDGGSPCPEDSEFFKARPDAAEIEEAISKFVSGLECQEQCCYHELHLLLSKRLVPVAKNVACCSIGLWVSSQND